jgi:uncharacterized membrane protein YgaE (UPF0421/DUF939 family)
MGRAWSQDRSRYGSTRVVGKGWMIVDMSQIEQDLLRILSSRKSMIERSKKADALCQRINEYHRLLQNEEKRIQFRKEYKALIDSKRAVMSDRVTSKSRLLEQMIDHANNLEKVEAIGEKLNRELGDF